MKRFNFEDCIFELDSDLLCNIDALGGTGARIPGQLPVEDDVNAQGIKDEKVGASDELPPANGADKKDGKDDKTPLTPPSKDISKENAKIALYSLADAEKTVTSVVALLQAIIKMNRERKDMELKMLWSECQNICKNIEAQAKNIRADALKGLIVGICCSVISIGAGSISIRSSVKSLSGLKEAGNNLKTALSAENITKDARKAAYKTFDQAKAKIDANTQFWNAISDVSKGVGQLGNSLSEYFSKQMEADNKTIDATNEVLRTAMEEIKKSVDDARNSITSAQSNMNELLQTHRQTTNKVMG